MDKFFVKGEDLTDFYQTGATLGQIFSDIEKDLQAMNRVVCRYVLNGVELREEDEQKFLQMPVEDIQTLEYFAENSDDLVHDVIYAWVAAVPELIQATEKIAQVLRLKGPQGQLKNIHELIHNCEYLIDSMISLKYILSDAIMTGTQDWIAAEKISHATVSQAVSAMLKKDFNLLADILDYDLVNTLQKWQVCLINIQQHLGEIQREGKVHQPNFLASQKQGH